VVERRYEWAVDREKQVEHRHERAGHADLRARHRCPRAGERYALWNASLRSRRARFRRGGASLRRGSAPVHVRRAEVRRPRAPRDRRRDALRVPSLVFLHSLPALPLPQRTSGSRAGGSVVSPRWPSRRAMDLGALGTEEITQDPRSLTGEAPNSGGWMQCVTRRVGDPNGASRSSERRAAST
jgi:hypothetical protein